MALTAVGAERNDDVVAGLDVGDAGANLLHGASNLMAEHHGCLQRRTLGAIDHVQVRVAHAASHDLDEYLVRFGAIEVHGVDRKRLRSA